MHQKCKPEPPKPKWTAQLELDISKKKIIDLFIVHNTF